jgi:hypothetical protein
LASQPAPVLAPLEQEQEQLRPRVPELARVPAQERPPQVLVQEQQHHRRQQQ